MAVNMAQYGLLEQHLGVVRFDMAKNDLFCARPLFDAIVTDRMSSLPIFSVN